jgi:P4 family phage/plasmid primase-like protien
VVDFDDPSQYETLLNEYPALKNHLTVKTNKGYHIYFKYESKIKTDTNVNGFIGVDTRNDGGLIVAPPTKYKLLNGQKVKYTYLYGDLLEMPKSLLNQLIPEEPEEPEEQPKKETKKKELIYNEGKTKEEFIERLTDLLDDSRADDRTEWTEVSFIINNELGRAGLPLFQSFSQRSDKYSDKKDDKWFMDLQTNERGLHIGTLMKKAKEDDKESYKELIKEFIKTKAIDDPIKATFTMLEKDIAEYIISNLLNNNFICHQLKPAEFHYFNGNSWVYDGGNQKLLIIIYDDLINKYESLLSNTDDKEETEIIKKLIKKLKGKLPFIHSIVDWIALLTFNIKFFEIIDENPDLLGFTNGVYEINNKVFREGRREDYITKTTGYEFPIDDDYGHKNDIKDFLIKVFPNEDVRNFVLQTQAQALSGRKTEDLIYTHTGRGGNGKSILIEILKNVFGDYFLNIPVAMLTKANNKGHNDPDPYMAKLKGVRYAMSNEPKDGASFNDQLIKNLGSQEALQYRMLYSNSPVNLNIQLKLNIYCNNKLKFNGEDEGIGRRMCVVNYISRFSKEEDLNNNVYLIDTELTDKVKNWKQDYMKLLISLHQNNYKHKPPIDVVDASKVYINENNDVYKFVKDNYERTNNNKDFIILKDVKLLYQSNKEYEQTKLKSLKESLEKIFNSNFIDDKKINGKKYTSVMMGWRVKIDEESDDDVKGPLDL